MDDYLGRHEERFKGPYVYDDFIKEFEIDFEPLEEEGEDNPLGGEDEQEV